MLVRPFLMNEQASVYILGLETSCDETAAAIVERQPSGHGKILSNIVRSQIKEHQAYGGVVPELAARAHVVYLDRIIGEALKKADMKLKDIDAIAATAGPGLIGGVLVGLTTAKALAAALDKPLIAINHLEAHALVARLGARVEFPFLMLLVSGGHSQFLLVGGVGDYKRWGTTIDDALGEAFDKVAKMLSLDYPGGPEVEREALKGDFKRFDFPRPLLREDRLDFSFSGLKTAVRLAAERIAPLDEQDVADICAGFQYADGLDRPRKGVNDGNGFLFISHIGEIQPSGFLPITAGNVREDDIVEVYRTHPIFRNLRDPSKLKGRCGRWEYKDLGGGQRGRAYGLTGDYLAEDPACLYVPEGAPLELEN